MLSRPPLAVLVLLAGLLALALLLPLYGGTYAIKFATRVCVIAIFVISLDFLIGITGLVSFGHAMFFGLGAYAVYFLSPKDAGANAFVIYPAAILIAGVAACAIGALAVLTRGFYFIMVTLAFGQMLFSLFHDTRFAGGSDGAYINVRPEVAVGPYLLLDLDRRVTFYFLCLGVLVATYAFFVWLARTPFGRVLQGIRWNEERIGALGFNTYTHKLTSFTIAGAVAGLAGALFATIDGYVAPDLFGWRESGLAIMMVVLGGVGTLFGPVLGAVLYSLLEEVLKTSAYVGRIADHWSMALGAILIAAVLAAPRGIGALLLPNESREATPRPEAERAIQASVAPSRGKSLEIERLSRSFGGLVAVDGVSLKLEPNRVHAIIGPNGAGKTTFINLLSGALGPTAGTIRLDRQSIGGWPAYAVARQGLGRSYQRTNIFLPFTVRENCALAAQARHPSPLRLGRGRFADEERNAVERALRVVGLEQRAEVRAAHLSHGEQRQLEIAMLLATGAKALLLDEPLAGMGPEETGRVTEILRGLAQDHTIILVEHDIDAIFAAADTVTVLVEGKLLAHGKPEDIRRDASVREAYLGRYGQEAPA